jgi:preprotein translocase subunit SecG
MELLNTLMTVVHVMTCLVLCVSVLLQSGRGGGLGGGIGGAGATQVFGGRGAGGFLVKITVGASLIFLVTCLTLARLSSEPQTVVDLGSGTKQQDRREDPILEEGKAPWDPTAAANTKPLPADAPMIPEPPVIRLGGDGDGAEPPVIKIGGDGDGAQPLQIQLEEAPVAPGE